MTKLWFCEDDDTKIGDFEDSATPEGITSQVLRTLAAFKDALGSICPGDVVSIDSQMPASTEEAVDTRAGEIIAATLLSAEKQVHLVWHSGNAVLPRWLKRWGVVEERNERQLKQLAARLRDSGNPEIAPQAALAAREFLARLRLDLPLMVLWVLCEGYLASERTSADADEDVSNWFAPIRKAIQERPADWQWSSWSEQVRGADQHARGWTPVKRLVERILGEPGEDIPGSWRQEIRAAHEVLKGRFL